MKSLFIDTSSFFVNISIVDDEKIVFQYKDKLVKDMSSIIMKKIREGFDSLNFSINDINKIFVVNGPGSFTGIRIGVSVAKTIAWALNKDIIPISSLEFIATTKTNTLYNISLIDARRGNVFVGIYDIDLNCIKADELVCYINIEEVNDPNYTLVSYDLDSCFYPNTDVIKIINKHKNDLPINPHNVNPNYLKKTEAEENLND